MQLSDRAYKILFLLLIVVYVYRPVALVVGIDRYCRLRDMLVVLMHCWLYARYTDYRALCKHRMTIAWVALMGYHIVNAVITSGAWMKNPVFMFDQIWSILICIFLLLLSAFLFLQDSEKTPLYMLVTLSVFLLSIFVQSYVFLGAGVFNGTERMSGAQHATRIAQTGGVIMFLTAYVHWLHPMKWYSYLPFMILGLAAALFAQGRNGLAVFAMGAVCFFFADYLTHRMSVKRWIAMVALLLIGWIAIQYMLDNTIVGQRFGNLDNSLNYIAPQYRTGTIFDKLGERAAYYSLGAKDFLEHPIHGIGMDNFMSYNHYEYHAHPEYIVHLAEGGLIAVTLFLLFLGIYGSRLFQMFRYDRDETIVTHCAAFVSLLFVGLTSTYFSDMQYWPLIGFALADIYRYEKHSIDNDSGLRRSGADDAALCQDSASSGI